MISGLKKSRRPSWKPMRCFRLVVGPKSRGLTGSCLVRSLSHPLPSPAYHWFVDLVGRNELISRYIYEKTGKVRYSLFSVIDAHHEVVAKSEANLKSHPSPGQEASAHPCSHVWLRYAILATPVSSTSFQYDLSADSSSCAVSSWRWFCWDAWVWAWGWWIGRCHYAASRTQCENFKVGIGHVAPFRCFIVGSK